MDDFEPRLKELASFVSDADMDEPCAQPPAGNRKLYTLRFDPFLLKQGPRRRIADANSTT
jgi:hypothetical protein